MFTMFKSVVQCAKLGSVNLKYCEYTCVHYLRPQFSNISLASYKNIGLSAFLFSDHIPSKHFSTNHVPLRQPGSKIDACTNQSKENTSSVLSDPNSKESAESFVKNTPDLFESLDYDEITGGDEENLSKFKLLLLEADVLRQDGWKVPKTMSTGQWKELFTLKSKGQRIKFLNYLWTTEMKKLSDKRKKEERKAMQLEKRIQLDLENSSNEHIKYGFQGSTIFVRVYETTINLHYNNRLIQAMKFGQNVVIDCGYDVDMSPMENKLCAKQLGILFAENRKDREPFNLQFCNVNRSGIIFKQLKKLIPTIDDPYFPMNIKEEHYLDLFPKEKLVYLTPHCRTELLQFNHDDIYIIGALVDKRQQSPLSLAKAKSEGIRMAQLPLDRYLQWALGTKSLTINQVLSILLDIRTTGDWNEALKHVPQRKIHRPDEPIEDTRKYRRENVFQYERRKSRFY